MTERARYVAVGLTVLIGLGLLAIMILLFAILPEALQSGYEIEIHTESTGGAEVGNDVHLGGLKVGRVTRIAFRNPDDPMEGITVTARIKPDIHVPANVTCYMTRNIMTGSVYIELYPDREAPRDPQTGKPMRFLPTDRVSAIPGEVKSSDPVDALKSTINTLTDRADKVVDSFVKLGRLADTIHEMLSDGQELPPPPATGPSATGPSASQPALPPAPSGLKGTIVRLNRTLDALYAVMGDAENRANIKAALGDLVKATKSANEAMEAVKQFALDARKTTAEADKALRSVAIFADDANDRMEEITKKLIDSAEGISKLVTTMNQVAAKIESGKGSAGKLINDAELYDSLLEAAKQMNVVAKNLAGILEQWKKKGVEVKLK